MAWHPNHSPIESVVTKLKKAQPPWHHILLITDHAEVDEGERRTLSHIASGFSKKNPQQQEVQTLPSLSSLSVPPTSAVVVLPSSASQLSSAAAYVQTSVPPPTLQTSLLPTQMPVLRSVNNQAAQHFNCTVTSLETQGLIAGTMQYFWAKVYFKSPWELTIKEQVQEVVEFRPTD